MAARIVKIICIIPFAPSAYKTGLENINHIRIRLPVTLVLRDMLLHDTQWRIMTGIFRVIVRISKTQNTFHAFIAQHLHILIKRGQHFVRKSSLISVIVQIIEHHDQRKIILGDISVQV